MSVMSLDKGLNKDLFAKEVDQNLPDNNGKGLFAKDPDPNIPNETNKDQIAKEPDESITTETDFMSDVLFQTSLLQANNGPCTVSEADDLYDPNSALEADFMSDTLFQTSLQQANNGACTVSEADDLYDPNSALEAAYYQDMQNELLGNFGDMDFVGPALDQEPHGDNIYMDIQEVADLLDVPSIGTDTDMDAFGKTLNDMPSPEKTLITNQESPSRKDVEDTEDKNDNKENIEICLINEENIEIHIKKEKMEFHLKKEDEDEEKNGTDSPQNTDPPSYLRGDHDEEIDIMNSNENDDNASSPSHKAEEHDEGGRDGNFLETKISPKGETRSQSQSQSQSQSRSVENRGEESDHRRIKRPRSRSRERLHRRPYRRVSTRDRRSPAGRGRDISPRRKLLRSRSPISSRDFRQGSSRRWMPRRRSPLLPVRQRSSPVKRRPPSPPPIRRSTGSRQPGKCLYVAGFGNDTTEGDLESKFSNFGNVKGVRVVRTRAGDLRGYAFLAMETDHEADEAIRTLNGAIWNNKILVVQKSKTCLRV